MTIFGRGIFSFYKPDPGSFTYGDSLTSVDCAGPNLILHWKEIETSEGLYDFRKIDKVLADATAVGKHVVLRIVTNVDAGAQATPDWFFALPNAQNYASSGTTKQPVPDDPTFQIKFGAFLKLLGARYDGHPAIEYVQTNAGGGIYGECLMNVTFVTANYPNGWDASRHIASIKYWMNQWDAVFKTTMKAIMVNAIGGNIGETAGTEAEIRGWAIQANTPKLTTAVNNTGWILNAHAAKCKIAVEVENGNVDQTYPNFKTNVIDPLFALGIPIDYLIPRDSVFVGDIVQVTTQQHYLHDVVLADDLRK